MKRLLITAAMVVGAAAFAQSQPVAKGSDDKAMQGQTMQTKEAKEPKADMAQHDQKKSGGKLAELGVMVPQDQGEFLNHLAKGNDGELEMAQLAKDRGTAKEVKDHAERMLKDHGALKTKLQEFAQKQQLTLGEPKMGDDKDQKMMDAHKATLEELKVMEGKAFDQAYLTAMLKDHDSTISKVMVATEQFRDSELATMLKKELPTLIQHRDLTYKALGKLKPDLSAMASPKKAK